MANREAAEQALVEVLGMFESGELPAAIARTTIHRMESDAPSAAWSLGNQILMLRAGTADARGFRQWKAVGRSVTKGSRAFYILAPIKRKITDEAESGEKSERVIVSGFTGVPVFRLEDTDGAELETPDYRPAEFPPLLDVAERLGVRVSWLPYVDRFAGYYQPATGAIVLCSHDVSVFFHEIAHAAHDHVLRSRGSRLQGGQRASQEIVAETVAAALSHLYGFDGYVYHGARYVETYAKGQNPGRAAMKVLADVQAVLALLLEPAGADVAAADREAVTA